MKFENIQEAKKKIAKTAMADLMGCSEPPEGVEDQYPFNALAYLPLLPEEWRGEVDDMITFIYHNERRPDDMGGN